MLPKVNLRNMLVLHIFSLFRGITMVIHSVSGGHFVGFFSWQTMLKFSGTEAQVGMAGIFLNIYFIYIWKSLYMFFLFSWEPIYIQCFRKEAFRRQKIGVEPRPPYPNVDAYTFL